MRRSDHGNWEPPGGVLKAHEKPEEGVVREVQEETRVRIDPGRLTGVYKNLEEAVLTLVFEAAVVDGEAQQTDEALEVDWLTLDDVRRIFNRDYAAWVEDALREGFGPALRSQRATVKGASSSPSSDA